MRLSRRFVLVLWSCLASPALAVAQQPGLSAPSGPRSRADTAIQRVNALADEYLKEWLRAFPELPTFFGIPGARHDRLQERSAAAERTWQRREDRWLAELQSLDSSALENRPEWITYGLLREELGASTRYRICRDRVWTVHPLVGWQADYAALAELQPVGT